MNAAPRVKECRAGKHYMHDWRHQEGGFVCMPGTPCMTDKQWQAHQACRPHVLLAQRNDTLADLVQVKVVLNNCDDRVVVLFQHSICKSWKGYQMKKSACDMLKSG